MSLRAKYYRDIVKGNRLVTKLGNTYIGVDNRVYQKEKKGWDGQSKRTRILSKEEHKRNADATVTTKAIGLVQMYLDPKQKWESDRYKVLKDNATKSYHGDSEEVFKNLCEDNESALFYRGWTDLYMSMKNNYPLRTEPIKIIKLEGGHEELPIEKAKPIFKNGDNAWTYIKEGDDLKPVMCVIASYYIKKLREGEFDVMYECRCQGRTGSYWRLQGIPGVFDTLDGVEEFIASKMSDYTMAS